MAGSSRELAILVTAKNMASGVLKNVRGDIRDIKSEAKRGLQQTARNVAFIGGAAAVGLGALVTQSIRDASELEQSMGAVDSVFGKNAETLQKWADQAAQSAGLSKRQVLQMGAVVGAQLQGMGFSAEDAAEKTVDLEKRAADLAATFGGTTEDAIQSISALLRGERDPIEKYGVSLKQADINARVAAKGLDTSTASAKKQSEAVAALELLFEQTAKTQGQFSRESDTLAGAQARLRANLENTRSEIGNALLPSVAKVADRLNEAVSDHMPEIKAFAAELPGVFDDLLTIIESLPWGTIKDSFALMGSGAKALLDAFAGLPSWVQTAVLTGWGLNKLTGGALGNIAGMLGKGAFGALRGSTPANPVFTKEVGVPGVGGGPVAGGKGGGGGLLGKVGGPLALAGGVVAAGVAVKTAADFDAGRDQMQVDLKAHALDVDIKDPGALEARMKAIESQINQERPFFEGILFNTNVRPVLEDALGELQERKQQQETANGLLRDAIPWQQRNVTEIQNLNQSEAARFGQEYTRLGDLSSRVGTGNILSGQQLAKQADALAAARGQTGILEGIRNKKTSVTAVINTTVNVSLQEWQRKHISSVRANAGSGGFI